MKRFLAVVVFVIGNLLCSCNKEAPIIVPDSLIDEKKMLLGNWVWTHTDHQYGWCNNDNYSEVINPISSGENYRLEIIEEGIVRFYLNDFILRENKIVFDYFNPINSSNAQFHIFLDGDENKHFGGLGNDSAMQFIWFPFIEEKDCGQFDNYFIKE